MIWPCGDKITSRVWSPSTTLQAATRLIERGQALLQQKRTLKPPDQAPVGPSAGGRRGKRDVDASRARSNDIFRRHKDNVGVGLGLLWLCWRVRLVCVWWRVRLVCVYGGA